MANFSRSAGNQGPEARDLHQLVSEPLDPVFESSRGRSSSHGGSGGGSSEGRRVPAAEERILAIEGNLRALSGSVLDLSGRFDKLEDKFDKFERNLEELIRSSRYPEVPTQTFDQTPFPHYSIAAQSSFPSIQMSNSPIHAHINHSWSVNPPVLAPVMFSTEQTPFEHTNSHQKPRSLPMESMTSGNKFMLNGLHMEPEERIRILTLASKKYKAKKDSKATGEQPQLYSPSPPKYHTALCVLDEMCEENLLMDKEKKEEEESKEPTVEEFPDSSFQEVSILDLDASLHVEDQDNLYLEEDDLLEEATSEFLVPTVDTENIIELQSDGHHDVHMVWNPGICVDEALHCAPHPPSNATPVEATMVSQFRNQVLVFPVTLPAMEMTKGFDTNYLFIVPEGPNTRFSAVVAEAFLEEADYDEYEDIRMLLSDSSSSHQDFLSCYGSHTVGNSYGSYVQMDMNYHPEQNGEYSGRNSSLSDETGDMVKVWDPGDGNVTSKQNAFDHLQLFHVVKLDGMMVLFLQVIAYRSSMVHEEAMLAIGSLAYATGPKVAIYMHGFYKYLNMGLQNFEEYPIPTQAEVADAFEAVWQQADTPVLSSEPAREPVLEKLVITIWDPGIKFQ